MNFEFTAGSRQIELPMYTFANDDVVSVETYAECMKAPYTSIVSYVKGAAEAGGLDLDQETLERWKRVCSAMYFIDEFLDSAPDRDVACAQFDDSLRYTLMHDHSELLSTVVDSSLQAQLVPVVTLLKNSMQTLPDTRIITLIEAACDINKIALAKTTVSDSRQYIALLQHEATQTGKLLSQSVSESVYHQPNFNQFANWCHRTMTMAILADSAVDLRKDYRENIITVSPTPTLIAQLALSAMTPAVQLAVRHPKSTIGSLLERLRFGHMI